MEEVSWFQDLEIKGRQGDMETNRPSVGRCRAHVYQSTCRGRDEDGNGSRCKSPKGQSEIGREGEGLNGSVTTTLGHWTPEFCSANLDCVSGLSNKVGLRLVQVTSQVLLIESPGGSLGRRAACFRDSVCRDSDPIRDWEQLTVFEASGVRGPSRAWSIGGSIRDGSADNFSTCGQNSPNRNSPLLQCSWGSPFGQCPIEKKSGGGQDNRLMDEPRAVAHQATLERDSERRITGLVRWLCPVAFGSGIAGGKFALNESARKGDFCGEISSTRFSSSSRSNSATARRRGDLPPYNKQRSKDSSCAASWRHLASMHCRYSVASEWDDVYLQLRRSTFRRWRIFGR